MSHELEQYISSALDVVWFKLVRSRKDLENDEDMFHPEMAHQIFGKNENIFGYKDLSVTIKYTAGSMYVLINVEYTNKITENTHGKVKADNIIQIITSQFPADCYRSNLDDFAKLLDNAGSFKPYGTKLCEHITEDKLGNKRQFEIYYCNYETPQFLPFFSRVQTFVLWFVDAACYIDVDDLQWMYFVCYEKYKNSDGNYEYATVGYTTVYQYYAFPEHIRPRISQMLILPPFQKMGLGTKCIETIYGFFRRDNTIVDITVEDPSDEFQRLRNYIDAKLCKSLPSFRSEVIKNGFTKEMEKEAKETWKINSKQCRKVYEILRLHYTNRDDPEDYKNYRLQVKNRLNTVYRKQKCDMEKVKKAGLDTNWMTKILSDEERMEQLNQDYKKLEEEYDKVLKRMA